MSPEEFRQSAQGIAESAQHLANEVQALALNAQTLASQASSAAGVDPSIGGLTVFALACFVGYYVVWKVTPALHSPLMGVTNAISSVIIVGAIIAAGPADFGFAQVMGFLAIVLASVNIFGGFIVTQRMLSMFKKKTK